MLRFPIGIVYEFTWKCHNNCIKKVQMCVCRGHAERREGSNKLFNLLKGTGLGIRGILGRWGKTAGIVLRTGWKIWKDFASGQICDSCGRSAPSKGCVTLFCWEAWEKYQHFTEYLNKQGSDSPVGFHKCMSQLQRGMSPWKGRLWPNSLGKGFHVCHLAMNQPSNLWVAWGSWAITSSTWISAITWERDFTSRLIQAPTSRIKTGGCGKTGTVSTVWVLMTGHFNP